MSIYEVISRRMNKQSADRGLIKLSQEEAEGLAVAAQTLTEEEAAAVADAIEKGELTEEDAIDVIAETAETRIAEAMNAEGAEDLDLVPEETTAEIVAAVEAGEISPDEAEAVHAQLNEEIAGVVADALEEEAVISGELAEVEPQA